MLKIFGLLLILLSCSGGGIYYALNVKKQLYDQREILSFTKYIRQKIEHFNSPLETIYSNYQSENPRFKMFLENLKLQGWQQTAENSDYLHLSPKTRGILKDVGEFLGKTPRKEQLNLLNYSIESIRGEYTAFEKKAPEKIKLSVTLSIYAGLMIIILFI